jgi:prepilin signal peptidase PulO-like enzyme (type II secretory pathway)
MALWLLVLLVALSLPAGWITRSLIERGPTDAPLFGGLRADRPTRVDLVVHVLVVVGFLAVGLRFGDSSVGVTVAMAALCTVLVALSMIDIATYRLPDRIVLPMLCGSIVWITAVSLVDGQPERIRSALLGSLVYFGVLLLAHLVSPRGMGFGDVKLAALLGLYLGWIAPSSLDAVVLVLWAMLIGFAVGTIVGVIILLRRRSNRPFPFGPFLAIGTVIALLASARIIGG